MTFPTRPCPVCGASDRQLLYDQRFVTIQDVSLFEKYDVVSCTHCGASFADKITDQKTIDNYYHSQSKYENQQYGGRASELAKSNYRAIVAGITDRVEFSRSASILDIGCATGDLLAAFGEAGFSDLTGLDPSPVCARFAWEHHRLPVLIGGLFACPEFNRKFDLITLSSVLEHVYDLNTALENIRQILAPNGIIFIEVPDTTRFADFITVPFQQFSVEHINFFTPTSLINLLCANGYAKIAMWEDIRRLGQLADPALSGLFQLSLATCTDNGSKDDSDNFGLRHYIDVSHQLTGKINNQISELAKNQTPILVWGVGTHTQRLLATSDLCKIRISAFIDSNPNYLGKILWGTPIIAPMDAYSYSEPILISTGIFQNEIARYAREELKLTNPLIKLYDFDH